MDSQNTQANNDQIGNQSTAQQGQNMTADEAAASLAFATKLSQGLMPKAPQAPEQPPMNKSPANEPQVPPQAAPEIPSNVSDNHDEEKLKMFKDKLDGVIKDVTDKFEKKIADGDKQTKKIIEGIRGEIKNILNA